MRIFFTGGSGKAGRHVAPYLASQGHQVTNADLVPLGHPDVTDLRVDWHDDPIGELHRLWAVWEPQKADYRIRGLHPTTAPSYGVPGDL